MSNQANLRDVQALEDLRASLKRFHSEAQESLNAAMQESRRELDHLAERQQHWQNEMRRRSENLQRAKSAFTACQASGYRDRDGYYHQPDCRKQEAALDQAQRELVQAEAEFKNAQHWLKQSQQALAEYEQQSRKLSAMLEHDLVLAEARLAAKIGIVYHYNNGEVSISLDPNAQTALPNETIDRSKVEERLGSQKDGWQAAIELEEAKRMAEANRNIQMMSSPAESLPEGIKSLADALEVAKSLADAVGSTKEILEANQPTRLDQQFTKYMHEKGEDVPHTDAYPPE